MINDRRTAAILIVVVCAIYITARFWRLTDSCLWFDEIFSVHAAEHPWNGLFSFVAWDLVHPPVFYIVLKLWIATGGESVFWLRLLPLIVSCVAIIPFLLLCRELKIGFWTQTLALFLLAVNGSLIKYAQEVRMYSLLMCTALFSMWLFARFIKGKKGYLALIFINIVLVYTHYAGWLVVLTEVGWILLIDRTKWRRIAAMVGVVFASFFSWMLAVSRSSVSSDDVSLNIGWIARPGIQEIATLVIDLVEPFYYQADRVEPASIYRVSIPVLIVVLAAVAAGLVKWNKHETKAETVCFALLFAFLPLTIVLIASWILPYSVWGTRHLIIIAAPVSLLVAMTLGRIQHLFRTAAVTLLMLFSGHAFYLQSVRATPQYFWCEWEPAARSLSLAEAQTTRPVKIYTFEPLAAYHIWFALRETNRFEINIVDVTGISGDDEYFVPRGFDDVRRATVDEITDESIWLVFRTERAGQEDTVLEPLTQRGYMPCRLTRKHIGTTTIFSIKMTSVQDGCG